MTNQLLERMPGSVRRELSAASGEFCLGPGESIPQESLEGSFVFIVERGVASKLLRSDIGMYSEVGMVGREGMFPIAALLQVTAAPHIVISQVGQLSGRRVRTREFHAIIDECPEAKLLVRKYIYAFLTQISSNILTSEQDMVEKRLARWLLMCHDRIEGDVISITHETLAQMAFAQRPTVTNALNEMRARNLIDLSRGRIEILSRTGLHKLADGAYGFSEQYWRDQIGPFGKDALSGPAGGQGQPSIIDMPNVAVNLPRRARLA